MSNCQWDRTPKSRKIHVCDVCGIEIPKGTIYHKQSGIHDGHPYTWKVHQDCAQLYWKLNEGMFWYDEYLDVYDFDWATVEAIRGFYPHAVTRMELMKHRWDVKWESKIAARRRNS